MKHIVLIIVGVVAACTQPVDAQVSGQGAGLVKCTTSGLASGQCTYSSPLASLAYTDGTSMTGSGSAGSALSTALGIATAEAKLPGIYGSGVDGSVHFDGTATVLGLVPNTTGACPTQPCGYAKFYVPTKDINATDLTIDSNVYVYGRYRIFATGTLTVNGRIGGNGNPANGTTAGGGFPSTVMCGQSGIGGATNGGASSALNNNPIGLTTTTSTNNGGTAGNAGSIGNVPSRGGGGGGATGAAGGQGGSVQTTVASGGGVGFFDWQRCFSVTGGVKWTGGTGGGGGAGASGGAGGGAASWVIVGARVLSGSGSIQAAGGAGGDGASNGGGGGGGGGGFLLVYYSHKSSWTGTITAPGGVHGAGNGTGKNGGDGADGVVWNPNMSGDGT